jgi:hypothetical protein
MLFQVSLGVGQRQTPTNGRANVGKALPQPRALPVRVGFGIPHQELFRACRVFWEDLERAEREGADEAEDVKRKLGLVVDYSETWKTELYASTIHLFAAMTAEAAITTYAVVRYGEDQFKEHFRFVNPIYDRLRKVLHYLPSTDLSDRSEIVQILRRLFKIRNELVHAQAAEDRYHEDGTNVEIRDHLSLTKQTAAQAITDLHRLLAILGSYDDEIMPFLIVW